MKQRDCCLKGCCPCSGREPDHQKRAPGLLGAEGPCLSYVTRAHRQGFTLSSGLFPTTKTNANIFQPTPLPVLQPAGSLNRSLFDTIDRNHYGVITWDELEQALGSQSRASSGRKQHQHEFRPNTHRHTHEHAPSTHLQHTQTHTNTQLQHTNTRTRSFERQTRRCTSRTHVITDTQHARDITTHAQHNTYPPIALLPPPFSRIRNPSNMSQKHGARFWVLSVCSPC